MKQKFIYIIILNWNGFADTQKCISSLLKIKNINFKIILVDNGSKNPEGEKLKKMFPNIILLFNKKNLGFCGGNNIGINYSLKQSDCEYIMLLNNDTTVDKFFLHPLARHLEKNKKSIVGPKMLYYSNPKKIQTMGGKLFLGGVYHIGKNKTKNKFIKKLNPDCISGACFIANKKAFNDVGVFDKNFFAYLEDLDWSVRAKNKNYNLTVLPQSIIYHKHSQSTKGSYFKVFLLARNNIYFAKKHYKGIKKYSFIGCGIMAGFLANLIRYKNLFFLKNFIKGVKDGLQSKKYDKNI